jgi:hypothetical protein
MVSIAVFHAVMLLFALGIAIRIIPTHFLSEMLNYLHQSIGITTPAREQVRTIALVWVGSTLLIVDGCLLLTVLLISMSHPG